MKDSRTSHLATSLAAHDLPLLRTAHATEAEILDPPALIGALAMDTAGRLGEILIALFLRHPTYAQYVPTVVGTLPPAAAHRLKHLYTAAVYLQHLWRGVLGLYITDLTSLPNYYGQADWQLPPPSAHFGEAGLRALAEQMQAETGDNWLSSYQNALSLLLTHLRQEAYNAA